MQLHEALQLIKQVLDAATKAGVYQNIDSAAMAASAFNVVAQHCQDAAAPAPAAAAE